MTEKVSLIKNPLTIIAIFAGIAEVSGTIVLPFVAAQNQQLFIWFLIIFPSALVLAFFGTLNFNNKVLYAPSDYKDEGNYLISNRYNPVTQNTTPVKESINDAFESIVAKVEEIEKRVDARIFASTAQAVDSDNSATSDPISIDAEKSLFKYQVSTDLRNSRAFAQRMKGLGYFFELYTSPNTNTHVNAVADNKAIWLGADIPLSIVKQVITEAKRYFPRLTYIALFDEKHGFNNTEEIFIGGSTKTSVERFKLNPIDSEGFEKLKTMNSIEDLHSFVKSFSDGSFYKQVVFNG